MADVNYGGSTGYGRKYRKRLAGNWGVVDVDDCCAAATHLAEQGRADPKKLCITGGSAGGYTTLACLAFRCASPMPGMVVVSMWSSSLCLSLSLSPSLSPPCPSL